MANPAMGDKEPTFNLPTGGSSDFYLAREVNDSESDNNGKVVRKDGLNQYPFLTRRTGDSLVGTNEEITSSELRHGRTAGKTKIGNASSSGSHDFELSPETFDDQLEGVFRSKWVRWTHDGASDLITKKFLTPNGYIHVRGEDGTYNQFYDAATDEGKGVTQVPLLYTGNESGAKSNPFGLIKVSPEKLGNRAVNPTGRFIVHELHVGDDPVKYSFVSRIPINDDIVRYQHFRHVECGEINLNVTVNAIVTGSFTLSGSNNPSYFTEVNEVGKKRMATKMADDKSVATGSGENYFSDDFEDGAEKFIAAIKKTTESTNTDQFTALEGFLYVNGHQIQFASDLTMDLNNNLQPINAIFVKNAIANISPSLTVNGNITAYFTDGEKDSTGKKFGADDLKNLASENKDVEILYAFQDKEDPEVVYIFQIFKSTISAPTEEKGADSPISLSLPYNSFGEMAVRCLRIVLPKVRKVEFDVDGFLSTGDSSSTISVRLVPNVPLVTSGSAVEEGVFTDDDYIDTTNTNGSYVFNNAEVSLNAQELGTGDFEFNNVRLLADGSIGAELTLADGLNKGDTLQLKVVVNGTDCEATVEIVPDIPYLRMGKNYASGKLESGKLVLPESESLNLFTAKVTSDPESPEDNLIYPVNSNVTADDLEVLTSDSTVISVSGTTITVESDGEATITIQSKKDPSVRMTFVTVAGEPLPDAETPTIEDIADVTLTEGDTLTLTAVASVSDGGTLSYNWSKGGTSLGDSATYEKTDVVTADSGTYSVTVTNTLNGKTATASKDVEVTVNEV